MRSEREPGASGLAMIGALESLTHQVPSSSSELCLAGADQTLLVPFLIDLISKALIRDQRESIEKN
jgi:hypothetical protein